MAYKSSLMGCDMWRICRYRINLSTHPFSFSSLHCIFIFLICCNSSVEICSFPFLACKLNVHKRCHKNVANNCGVNSKEMAQILKDMGLTGNKLSESMRVKKVCKYESNYFLCTPYTGFTPWSNISKVRASVSLGFQTWEKQIKAPSAGFYWFLVLRQ